MISISREQMANLTKATFLAQLIEHLTQAGGAADTASCDQATRDQFWRIALSSQDAGLTTVQGEVAPLKE